jgi:hypothetical protein
MVGMDNAEMRRSAHRWLKLLRAATDSSAGGHLPFAKRGEREWAQRSEGLRPARNL